MKLISCDHCAIILDGYKLPIPLSMYTEDGDEIDPAKADYNQRTGLYTRYVNCPLCKNKIFLEL